jgi:hypothetical protein
MVVVATRWYAVGFACKGEVMKYESALVTQATGHLNGLTASKNTYGQYFKGRVKGVNPKTALQDAARNAFSAVSQTWRALTKAQQSAWAAASSLIVKKDKLGKTITLTGSAAYQSAARKNLTAGIALPTDPPSTVLTSPQFTAATLNGTTGVCTVLFAVPPSASNPYVVLASNLVGVGKNFVRRPTTYIGTATANPFTFSTTSGNTAAKALASAASGSAANGQCALAAYAAATGNLPSPSVVTRALVIRP